MFSSAKLICFQYKQSYLVKLKFPSAHYYVSVFLWTSFNCRIHICSGPGNGRET